MVPHFGTVKKQDHKQFRGEYTIWKGLSHTNRETDRQTDRPTNRQTTGILKNSLLDGGPKNEKRIAVLLF